MSIYWKFGALVVWALYVRLTIKPIYWENEEGRFEGRMVGVLLLGLLFFSLFVFLYLTGYPGIDFSKITISIGLMFLYLASYESFCDSEESSYTRAGWFLSIGFACVIVAAAGPMLYADIVAELSKDVALPVIK